MLKEFMEELTIGNITIGTFIISATGFVNKNDPLVWNYMLNSCLGIFFFIVVSKNRKNIFSRIFYGIMLAWVFTAPITMALDMYSEKPTSMVAFVFGFLGYNIVKTVLYLINNPSVLIDLYLKLRGKK